MKIFQDPYVAIEKSTPEISAISYKGSTIYCLWITNRVINLSADKDAYEEYHNYLSQIVSTLGEGYAIQKTDVFYKEPYTHTKEELENQTFLQAEYSKHFEGRISQKIRTVLSISRKTEKVVSYSKKNEEELFDAVQQVYRILKMAMLEPKFFNEKDYDYYYASILTQNFSPQKMFSNFKVTDSHINFGDKIGISLPFFDTEKIELPNEISPYTTLDQTDKYSAVTDNFAFLTEIKDAETIILNQYIEIPNQTEMRTFLNKKKNRHVGLQTEQYNADCANEIDEFIGSLEKNNELIVNSHVNLFVTAKNEEKLKEIVSLIATKMYQKNIVLSKSSCNQYELFRTIFAGISSIELKEYDLFTTTTNVALSFFFKERFVTDDDSPFYLRFADRQGVPVNVDTADLPMQKGYITNRNKIILGPSGTGKSFLMNNIFEQCLQFNYDIVVIDVGDSYSSLCKFFNGKYITYKEDDPISMNPFQMEKEELNEEKLQTLVELLWIIWVGVDTLPSKTQSNILNVLMTEYYKIYFDEIDIENSSTEELILALKNYNISKEDLFNELANKSYSNKNYYSILGIEQYASEKEIKQAWRNKIKENHPDIIGEVFSQDNIELIHKAYKTLIDPISRKEYNETLSLELSRDNKAILKRNNVSLSKYNEDALRELAIFKLKKIKEELNIKELNFNSLYEFASVFMPLHLKAMNINNTAFNLDTFLYNMKPFYKGGRYNTMLNENVDSSLFDEKFIVFEVDNIKDNPQLFPIVTTIIMDTFIQKMRHRQNTRKALYIEEAWKAIASPAMAGSIKYLYKTVRKFYGEVGIVTQDLADIAKSEIVKDAILGSTDIVILLDQRKMKQNYDEVRKLLNLSDSEVGQIFTINNLDNRKGRGKFKEFWMRIGTTSSVYGMEVSFAQYLTYTTEKPEKSAVAYYLESYPENYDEAIKAFMKDLKLTRLTTERFVSLINDLDQSLNDRQRKYIEDFVTKNQNPLDLLLEEHFQKLKTYEKTDFI